MDYEMLFPQILDREEQRETRGAPLSGWKERQMIASHCSPSFGPRRTSPLRTFFATLFTYGHATKLVRLEVVDLHGQTRWWDR